MDYEKKYKDALAHAREIHRNEEGKRKDMEFLFPELAESEDERIRKEIIDFLLLPHRQFVGKRNHKEWIDWLEKQGQTFTKKDVDDAYCKGLHDATTFKAEDWYVSKVDGKIYNAKFIDKNPSCINSEKQGEQEQTMDYPDNLPKDKWELVHEFVEKFGRIPEDEDELNALVEYVLKRQKSTWDKEDEEIYSRICYLIHAAAFENYDVDEVGKELGEYAKMTDWLKAIKTRCAWKPSNEQINSLRGVIFTLYNDLKKLKGE